MGQAENSILESKVRQDQLNDLKSALYISMPIGSVLSVLILIIQSLSGKFLPAFIWFTAVNLVNFSRLILTWTTPSTNEIQAPYDPSKDKQFRRFRYLALASGINWSFLAFLTDGYTSPEAPSILVILAGISAGSVVYGKSYSALTISFTTLPLLIAAGCLTMKGGIENYVLSVSIIMFWVGLVRGSLQSEAHFREASRLKHLAEQTAAEMEQNSRLDPLTGLLNRRGLEHSVQYLRDEGKRFVTMLIDLDGFKAVNDTYGHKMGDDILEKIAHKIVRKVPLETIIARIGGDEFVIIFPETNILNIKKLSKSIIDSISKYDHDVAALQLGACIGIYISEKQTLTDMLLRADSALYSAKRQGRNEFCIFGKKLELDLQRRNCIERDLRHAIDHKSINTKFQPIVRILTKEIIGFEALLRWSHPAHGPISPPEIVAVARETGMLQLLTETVFSDCLNLLENLLASGRREMRVAMNISPRELETGAIDDLILNGLRLKGIPPSMFEIEITEEAPIDPEKVDAKLGRLCEAGISIALDDFGTGFSTFASLKDKRISKVKIDKAFIRDLAKSREDQMLVKAVIDLGRALEIDVMAEGVETEEDRRTLQALGCETAQGYLFAQAMPPEEALALLALKPIPLKERIARYG